MAKLHARITLDNDDFFLEGLSATSEVYQNQKAVKSKVKLSPLDHIQIATHVFVFGCADSIAPSQSALKNKESAVWLDNQKFENILPKWYEKSKSAVLGVFEIDILSEFNKNQSSFFSNQIVTTFKSRLMQSIHPVNSLGTQLENDTIILLQKDVPLKQAVTWVQDLQQRMHNEPIWIGNLPFKATFTAQVRNFIPSTSNWNELFRDAIHAVYEARYSGGDCIVFSPEMANAAKRVKNEDL